VQAYAFLPLLLGIFRTMNMKNLKELPASSNKETTDFLKLWPLEKMRLQHHSDNSVELVASKSFDNQLELAKEVAKALNHYIISNNLAVKDICEACKMVLGDTLYIKIFSPEIGVSKELTNLLSDVAIEFVTNGFDNVTLDIGYNPPRNLPELEASMECLKQQSKDVLAINKKLGLSTTLHIEGPTTTGVIALKGTLKQPKDILDPDPKEYRDQHYKIIGSTISENSIRATPYIFGNQHKKAKVEVLYYEDKTVFDALSEYYFSRRDYSLDITERLSPDRSTLIKVVTAIRPIEAPKGVGKKEQTQENQAELELPN